MSHENTPHVCFRADLVPSGSVDTVLPGILERQFRAVFESVNIVSVGQLASLVVTFQTGEESFSAVLGRSKFERDEWLLLVGPPSGPGLLDRIRGHGADVGLQELMTACREIHTILTRIPGISAIRWYFEGSRTQSPAVETPDELPWGKHS
jgi:hypothetical protein